MNRRDPFNEGEAAATARRRRNLAIALGLVVFIVVVFVTTMVRLGQNIAAGRAASLPAAVSHG